MSFSTSESLRLRKLLVMVFVIGMAIQSQFFLQNGLDDFGLLQNLGLHGSVEMAGSIISVMVAYLLLRLNAIGEGSSFNYQISSALLSMSCLDGLHAMMPVSNTFVWLHSLATALGGLLFAMIWLPTIPLKPVLKYWPSIAAFVAILLGGFSLNQPEQLPLMLVSGKFTQAASILNFGGGILLLFAAVKLILTFWSSRKPEDLLFFFQCLVLAAAALMFEQSRIWDWAWWGWHLLRLAGCSSALWLVVKTANAVEAKTLLASQILKQQVEERNRTENQLRIAATTFETNEAIMITDADANIIRVNRAFETITGYRQEEVIGKNPRVLSSGRHNKEFYSRMWQELISNGTWTGEIWDRKKSGNIYPKEVTITAVKNEQGDTTQYVSIFTDISNRKEIEEEIYNLAFNDALTGLPNRRLMMDRLSFALSASARSRQYGALLFLDLDKFKTLNDTLGHEAGDGLLVEVAKRIKFCVREVDTVARLGGDEFLVLIENISTDKDDASQHVAQIAEKIRSVLATHYQLKEHTHHSSPSIGVCLFYGNDTSVEELVKRADMAMYQAKDSGRNRVRFFDPGLQKLVETRAAVESDLRRAIVEQQLHLYYQIQVDNELCNIGAEALIRWIHPKRGMVSPAQFIPIAEESSLILEIGNWVLDTACQQLAAWSCHEQTSKLTLAINVSARQFRQPDFVDQIKAVIEKYQVVPSRLKLELTESVELDELESVIEKMLALKEGLGIKLSLDDFGTGYSSLSYLKRLPLDQIKIDQSFVQDIKSDFSNAVMVKTIIDLARNFGLDVIAEGVETDDHLAFLRQYGCRAYQGYLFSKPLPIEQFEALLQQG